jgi:RNA polymerase sigma-70 factor (ECF subfamily)
MPTVDALIERAKGGDAAALEQLLTSVAPAVHRHGLRMCKSADDADDVLQDTLLAIASHLGDFEGRSSFSSWVFALARSACVRRRRGLKNRPAISDEAVPEPSDEAPTPEQSAADSELSRALGRALDGLPDDYREVILLRDMEGLTAPETAESLGVSVDAVKSRLHRAREALRDALRPMLEPGAAAPAPACPEMALLWSRKLEGDLSQHDCSEMQKHFAVCPACSAACHALKRALLACRTSAGSTVPSRVQAHVKAAMREWIEQSRSVRA